MDATLSFYRLAYRVGFHPWEDAEDMPRFVAGIDRLLAEEENGSRPPDGRALELGCGSGIWGIHLARRGWDVTSIDIVPRALRRARDRVVASGTDVRLVQGDVTALEDAGVGDGFRLVLDTGTFHGLDAGQRAAVGRGVDALTRADATVLLLAWNPRRRGPFPRGCTIAEIEAALPGWSATEEGETGFPPPALLRARERWYRLRRR
jgi:SAM-dependent methyltransferase